MPTRPKTRRYHGDAVPGRGMVPNRALSLRTLISEACRHQALGDLGHQFAGHRIAKTLEIPHFQHETARPAGHILAVVVLQSTGRLNMRERPGYRVLVDNGEAVDGDARRH